MMSPIKTSCMPGHERRMYDSVRWRKAAKRFLNEHPLCALCERIGRDTAANTVDHIKPHNGDFALFWDRENWQALCPSCHSGAKRIQELHGYSQACDVNGLPIDANHPFNRRRQ